MLESWLVRLCGRDHVVRTREPGGWDGGDHVRDILLHGNLQHPWSELFLFMYDRCEHIARVIAPNLSAGRVVLCERYHASTVAYQGWGRGIPVELLRQIEREAELPSPDVVLLLDVSAGTALTRLAGRASDRIEGEGGAFLDRVRSGFLELSEADASRWHRVDAEANSDSVHAEITRLLEPMIRDYQDEDISD